MSPSPHISVQEDQLAKEVHVKPFTSPSHVELHPSESYDPSSHVSGSIILPSPHIGVQTESEDPTHVYP